MPDLLSLLVITVAAFFAGGINALAGGGSFLTLPALVFAGVPAVSANATGTAALLPGYLASAWSYRDLMRAPVGLSLLVVLVLGTLGGAAGALLLLATRRSRPSVASSPGCCSSRPCCSRLVPALQRRLAAARQDGPVRARCEAGHLRRMRVRGLLQRRHGHRDAGHVPPAGCARPAYREWPEEPAVGSAHIDRGGWSMRRED
jgi:hypothetical protein